MKTTKNFVIKNISRNRYYSARLYEPGLKSELYVDDIDHATLYGKKSGAKKALSELPDNAIFQIIKIYVES
jgi:hypothetical protein